MRRKIDNLKDQNFYLVRQNKKLKEALEMCCKSLQTYGNHPIIKVNVESALKYKKPKQL